MATEAKNTNYWISSSALYIQLNAMGEPDYIQCSVVSGASILCYMQGIPGLEYDAGHNYQRWPLAAYPSVFPDSERKYIYAAIPRTSTADNNTAVVVYPSERIDLYGYSIANPDKLVGDERFYYIYLQGIISEVKTDADGKTRKRDWLQHVDCGKLNTDESLSSGIDGTWWKYNSVTDSISFLKTILSATFDTLTANVAKITKLFLGGSELNGVADDSSLETDNTKVVTPLYLGQFGVKHFLAKDKDDVAHGVITFEKVQKFLAGLNVGDSNSENGGSWTPDAEGRSHLITDYLEVRMKAIFEELVVKKTSTIGGKEIISPAGGVVAHKVEEVTVTYNNVSQKAYRCYFLAEQEGDSVDNDFALGDQVRSESFNVRKGTYHKVGNHFYWRLVIGRDEDPVELEGKKYHYIDLSDTDCATASDVPARGDVLNQCGNRTDVERQNCLIFSAVDTYSPSISLYHGINSYSFANKEYVEYGVNKQTNKAFFNVYGDMYVGDRPTKENGYEGSSYVKYDSATKQVVIKGKLSAKSTVDGKELSQYIKDNSAKGLTEEQVNNLINNSQVIADLQNQVDGAIETWFYEGVPTLKNAPAISWTTDKDKKTHLGDLYYDNKTGKAYRFAKDGNTYKWAIITDTDIAKALSDASKAQETADGKMKVFSTQPIPPYQLGDIWVNATYPTDGSTYKNEILRCQTAKTKGSSFAIADWTKASKYTDDSALNTFKEEYKNDMASYKEQLDEKVETWFYNYAPTTQNKPASDWTTDTLKSQHAGDLFYNTSNGYTYRWTGTAWARIKDNDINTAMTAASKAQDTADGKRTVFTSQPTVPYDEGDLWASGGDDGKTLMVCVKSRVTGSFTSSEWVKANDSDLNVFAKTIEESLKGIRDQLDKKAETWYQSTDPSASWTTDDAKKEHKGDLWYNTSNNQTFFWNGAKWDKQDVPTEVFDKIDGKSSIYVSKPASYEERDLWILEAAYTLGGVAYSKGELVVATKTNASFSAADWTKKVKYTDDTVANAAKKAAEEAKKAADTAQTNVTNLGKTVTSNKKAFDNYVTDGYLEPSEIAAMAQDSKRLEDAFAAAEKSYTEVKEAEVLKDTKELTDLNTAFVTLSTAKTELVTYLSDISARYNAANTEKKATIVSAVGTKFTNFQSAYSAFYDKLGLANAYITSKIYGDLGVVIGDVATYQYLKKVLADGVETEINGGLILTSLIALRDPETKRVESGINGVIDKTAKGNGIATWWGGYMNDGEVVGFDKKEDYSKQAATSLVRFDGSGYLANGAIWWGTDGRVHADPTSFIISEKNLGAYLTFFEPTWKAGSAGTSVADLVSLKPNAPFSKLGVSGDATFEGAITFHGIKLTYDATNKAIKVDGNLYATGGITAYGAGASTTGGGGGLNASVISYARIIEGNYTDADLTSIPNAYAIKALSSRIDNIATELGGLNLSWNNITGKPSTYTPSAHTHKWADITDRITKVSQLTNDSGYTKNTGTVTSVSLTLPAGLTCATKTITTSGTFAISLASGYSIPTTAKQTAWDSAYDWYVLMTTDEETADGIINKWNEVVSFLANIAQTDTLSGIVDGINKSISDEVTRAKKAEGVNASGISTNKTNITTLQGYFTSGSAKKALQLTNARKLWGNSFNGTADINGSIIVPSGKYISIGNIKMEYDATNKALKITNTTTEEVANLYTSGGVSAYGVGTSSSSGGGLNGSVKSYSDALKLASESLSEIASAYSIKALGSRISSLEGGSATAISVSGSGNAVTSITKNGTTISVVKGSTFLTSHQSLAGYATQDWVNAKGYITSSGSITGNAATATHASSADYIRSNGLPAPANNTVKAYKDSLVKFFKDFYPNNGVGANVNVSASIIRNWSDDSATFYPTSSYCFIKIGGAYNGTKYGQFLLSTYNLERVGIVGRTDDKWTAIKWLAYTDDIPKNNNQLTNGAGYITSAGSCKYATSAGSANSVAWSNVSGRPTKVSQLTNDSGYQTGSDRHERKVMDANDIYLAFKTYETAGGTNMPSDSRWHQIFSWGTGDRDYCFQIANDYVTNGHLYFRYKGGGTWHDWKTVIDSSNIGSQSVNYANSAGSVAWSNVSGRPTKVSQLTNDSGYQTGSDRHERKVMDANDIYLAFKTYETAGGTNMPSDSRWHQIFSWGTGDRDYCFQIANDYVTNGHLYFRYKGGGTWHDWKTVIDSSNIGSQSVNYANSAGSVAWANVSGRPTKVSQFTNDSGYITSSASITGNAATATKLQTARSLWGNSFNGTSDINGSIIVPSGKYISIGNIKLEYDAANKALKITNTMTNEVANLYTSGGVSAYGVGTSSSSGGGLNGSVKSYSDALKLTSESLSEIASAYSIKQLSARITSLEGGSATSISVSGSGNAVTSVTKNGTTISVVKGSTFLTSHQILDHIISTDKRSTVLSPTSYLRGVYPVFISNTTDGLLDGGEYHGVLHWRSYGQSAGDLSGGYPIQIAYTANGRLWTRIATSNTTWGDWKKIARTEDIPTKLSQLTNDKGYLTSHQSLAGYATQDWVNAKGYITSSGSITGNAATATHASSAYYIRSNGLPAPANNTVKAYKDSLVKFFKDFYPNNGVGANVNVSASIIRNWSDDSATFYPTSRYCFIKIGGAYNGTKYGQFLLSTYNLERVGIVGRTDDKWTAIKWLAYTDDIPKNNNQLTNGAGYITSAGSCKYATSAGSANSVAWSNVSGRPTKVSQLTNDSGYQTGSDRHERKVMDANDIYLAFKTYETAGGTNMPSDSRWHQIFSWGTGDRDYCFQIANDYVTNGHLYFRYKGGGTWHDWKTVIDSSNIGSQSVNYANSAGSVAWSNVSGRPTKVSQFTNDSGYITSSASITGNAATATKLQTARTIWGQSFNGTANVSGNLTGVNNITMSNNSYLYGKNTGGTAIQLIAMASWNSVDIGRGALVHGYTTQVMGKTVALTASDDSGKNVKSVELSTAKLYSNVNIETEGGLLAHGGVTAYSSSDIRLKQDLRKLDYLSIIKAMGGTFGFAWKKDNTRSIGFIAQHVLCNPHLKDIVETDEKGYYKINYWSPKLIATAFGAIEQVGDEVSRLKARVVFLESEVQRLSGKQNGNNKKRLDNKNINLLN